MSVCHFIAGVLNISEQSTLSILKHLLSSKWLVKCLEAIHSNGAILPNHTLISAIDVLVEIFAQLFDSKQRYSIVDLSVLKIAFADALPSISSVLLDYSKLYGLVEQAHGIVPKLGMERLKLYRLLSCIPLICDDELAHVFRACSLPKRFTYYVRKPSGHLLRATCCIRVLLIFVQMYLKTNCSSMVLFGMQGCYNEYVSHKDTLKLSPKNLAPSNQPTLAI